MKFNSQNRREFLATTALGAAMAPLFYGCGTGIDAMSIPKSKLEILRKNAIQDPDCEWCGARDVPDDVKWKTRLHRDGDPGQRMLIEGTVYNTDGVTPARDILIYFYHTDTEGYYGRNGEHRHGRYRGWMLTGEDGKFGFYTIKPAPYPNRGGPAHVHMTVTGLHRREDWADTIFFEGDPLLKEGNQSRKKGGFDNVIKLEMDREGILRGTRNLKLWKI